MNATGKIGKAAGAEPSSGSDAAWPGANARARKRKLAGHGIERKLAAAMGLLGHLQGRRAGTGTNNLAAVGTDRLLLRT